MEQVIYQVRKGLRKTFDDQVALLHMPKAIDFQFVVILRKDDLQRQELTSRDGTTTTATSGTSFETQQRTGAVSVTDEQEVMQFVRAGGENSATAGGEGGTETTAQTETSATAGGEGGTESTGQTETSATTGGEGGTESTSQTESSATTGGEGGTETTAQTETSATAGGEGGTQTENAIDASSESSTTAGGQNLTVSEGGQTSELYAYSHYDADN